MTERGASQESASFDPFAVWRQFYEANEEAWTKAVKEMVTTPDFAQMQGKMLESFLSYQKLLRDSMTAQMTSLNIPTRDDIARLGELIVGIEEKVDRIEERLEKMEELEERAGKIEDKLSRIKVTQIEDKVDDLAKQLSNLDDRVKRQGKSLEGEARAAAGSEASQGRERSQGGRSRGSAKE